jgi:hypothetical protein
MRCRNYSIFELISVTSSLCAHLVSKNRTMSLEVLTPEVAAKEAAGPLYTAASPGEFSAEKHVPKVSIADGAVSIEVPHGEL